VKWLQEEKHQRLVEENLVLQDLEEVLQLEEVQLEELQVQEEAQV